MAMRMAMAITIAMTIAMTMAMAKFNKKNQIPIIDKLNLEFGFNTI